MIYENRYLIFVIVLFVYHVRTYGINFKWDES